MSSTSPAPARPRLSSFWHDLPREGKLLISTVVFQSIGTGLVLPFLVVYLHEVRGISLETVGLLLALQAGVGIVLVTPAGALIDRIGPRRVYASSLVALMVADVLLALATTTGQAAAALALMGYGFGIVWPASSALIGNLIPTEQRQRYFGINFTLLNLGIGIGGIVGGRFVDVSRPGTFVTIYLLDALSYVPGLFILLVALRLHVAGRPVPVDTGPRRSATSRVLRRPAVAGADAARLRGVVRRLLPAQHRHARLRPGRGRGLDPGARGTRSRPTPSSSCCSSCSSSSASRAGAARASPSSWPGLDGGLVAARGDVARARHA